MIANFEYFLLESTNIKSKKELLGKKFYHGTTLETWNTEEKSYLHITDDESSLQFCLQHDIPHVLCHDQTKYDKLTAIVFEILIDENILNLKWEVDDDCGIRTFFKTWLDSYNEVGTFVIVGDYDSNKFQVVLKEEITKETPTRYL